MFIHTNKPLITSFYKKKYLFFAELAMSQYWSAIFCATSAWGGKPIGRVRVNRPYSFIKKFRSNDRNWQKSCRNVSTDQLFLYSSLHNRNCSPINFNSSGTFESIFEQPVASGLTSKISAEEIFPWSPKYHRFARRFAILYRTGHSSGLW